MFLPNDLVKAAADLVAAPPVTPLPSPAGADDDAFVRALKQGVLLPSSLLLNGQQSARVGLGGIGAFTGVTDKGTLGNIKKAVGLSISELIDINVDPALASGISAVLNGAEDLLDGIVQEMAQELVGIGLQIAGDLANIVPVVGAFVNIGISMGKLVRQSLATQNARNSIPYMLFNPETDYAVFTATQKLLLRTLPSATTVDWTHLFLPPGIGGYNTGNSLPFTVELEEGAKTLMIRPVSAIGASGVVEGGLGFIPGSPLEHMQACGNTRISKSGHVQDVRKNLYPTSYNQSLWIWNGYASPSVGSGKAAKGPGVIQPTLFNVNAAYLFSMWQDYLLGFRAYVESAGPKADRQKIIDYYSSPETLGWPKKVESYVNSRGVLLFKDTSWVEQTTPIRALRALKQQQIAALKTPMLAYVDERHAAIGLGTPAYPGDADVRAVWEKDRKLLLGYKQAACSINVANVPYPITATGGFFLDDLKQVRAGCGLTTGAPMSISIPAPMPPGYRVPGKPPRTPSSGGGAMPLLLAAAALAAFMAKKK